MRLLQRLICDFSFTKVGKRFFGKNDLRIKEMEEIHKNGKITSDEKAYEWERAGVCAPFEYFGDDKRLERCTCYSNDCHQCLRDFASCKRFYEPYSNNLDLIPDFNVDDQVEFEKIKKNNNPKRLVKKR